MTNWTGTTIGRYRQLEGDRGEDLVERLPRRPAGDVFTVSGVASDCDNELFGIHDAPLFG